MNHPVMEISMKTEILVPIQGHQKEIITTEALEFAALLHKTFNSTRLELLNDRKKHFDHVFRSIFIRIFDFFNF